MLASAALIQIKNRTVLAGVSSRRALAIRRAVPGPRAAAGSSSPRRRMSRPTSSSTTARWSRWPASSLATVGVAGGW